MRLFDVIHQLPSSALLTSTVAMDKLLIEHVQRAPILQALDAVCRIGYQNQEAELTPNGLLIQVYEDGALLPYNGFAIQYDQQVNVVMQQEAVAAI